MTIYARDYKAFKEKKTIVNGQSRCCIIIEMDKKHDNIQTFVTSKQYKNFSILHKYQLALFGVTSLTLGSKGFNPSIR